MNEVKILQGILTNIARWIVYETSHLVLVVFGNQYHIKFSVKCENKKGYRIMHSFARAWGVRMAMDTAQDHLKELKTFIEITDIKRI